MFLLNSIRRTFSRQWISKRVIITILIFIFTIVFYFCHVQQIYQQYDSFQEFSYPSMINFYKLLELNNTNNIPKLFQYQPKLINIPKSNNTNIVNIMIIVKSSIENINKRNIIRQSWGSKNCKFYHKYHVNFALGKNSANNKRIQNGINQESQLTNDILQFDFIDKYHNNTYKVMAIMDYFVKYHSDVPYLVIADDDYFINPSVLIDTINNNITETQYPRFLGGYVWFQTKPIRDNLSKWYVSYRNYKFEYYPPYPAGGFLLISNPMVKICNKLLPFLKYNSIDDVIIGILLFKLNIYPTHMSNVYINRPKPFPKNLLASHNVLDLKNFWINNHYDDSCSFHDTQ